MQENKFKHDLEIDPNELDVAAAMQGELFFKWAQKSVVGAEARDMMKLRLDVITADMSNKIRLDPDAYGVQKITETSIVTAVKASAEYIEAYEKWVESKKEAELLSQAVVAMEQRKRMIEILVTLHGQQYFAGPSVPRNLVEAWKEAKKGTEEKIMKRTKLRKRSKK